MSIRYIPNELLYRTEELKFLARHFKGLFETGDDGKNLVIHGPVGSGKTSISKKFGIWASTRDNTRKIEYVHINCRVNRSTYTILLKIARDLNRHIPSRGYSSHELLEMISDILEAQQISLILVLDEIDFVEHDEISDLIYSFCRTSDNKTTTNHYISLILIARTLNFLDLLDASTKSTLVAGKLRLHRYSKDQLLEIFTNRIFEVFKQGSVTDQALELTASIAGRNGDARKGLELLWYAGKYADQQNSPVVYPDYIRIAKSNIQPSIIYEILKSLSTQKLLIYHAVARGLQINKTAYITMGQLKDTYQISCEEFEETPRKHTQIWEYVRELSRLGLIETRISEEGFRGTSTLISIEDMSAAKLEQVVTELITE